MNVVITGAARGIGLELTRAALQKEASVLALYRKSTPELLALQKAFGDQLDLLASDVLAPDLVTSILSKIKAWPSLDVLINNAGIYPEGDSLEDFQSGFNINAVAPYLLTTGLAKKLKPSGEPKVAHVTSLMGSIADNSSGGHYAYRASKAALNMINKSLSVDHAWLTTIVVHPGWVKTDMGGPSAPLEPQKSAEGIWSVIQNLKPSDSGKFFDYRGRSLPW